MKNISILFLFFSTLAGFNNLYAQGVDCENAEPFCTDSGATFPAGTNQPAAPAGNNYDCLGTQPNPAWYYLQIDDPGPIDISLTNSNIVDVDFILWGPFSSITAATAECGGLGNGGTSGNVIDCSYSAQAFEEVNIPNAQTGEVYILLITNFSNNATNISADQINVGPNSGTTDCSILLPCAPIQFYDITANSPYDCNDPIIPLTAYPTDSSVGNLSITPGFSFIIQTDAFSSVDNTLEIYDGPGGTGSVVAYWGPTNTGGNYQGVVPNSATFEATVEYLDSTGTYSLVWCDAANNGNFTNEIYQSAANTLISNTAFSGATGCTTINLGAPEGFGVFSGPGVTNNNNGTGTFDPSVAGAGFHLIQYDWESSAGCLGTYSQSVVVCCDPGTPIISTPNDTICAGDTAFLATNIPGASASSVVFSNTTNTTINPGATTTSDLTVSGVIPAVLNANSIDSVCLNINQNLVAHLNITLTSPSGTSVDLTSGNGGIFTTSLQNVCFSPSALDNVTNYSGPLSTIPTDTALGPEQPFSNFAGDQTNGTWTLSIDHTIAAPTGNIGDLLDWTIIFAPSTTSNTYTWSGPNMSCTNCADPTVTPTVTSDYEVTATDGYGCSFTDTITIEVESALDIPVVSCGTLSNTSVEFVWPSVLGATGYQISLDTGSTWIAPSGALDHVVTGLLPGTDVQILVQALGGDCTNPIDTHVCTTTTCPLTFNIDNVVDVGCNGGNDGEITVSVGGGVGTLSYQIIAPTLGTAQTNGTFLNLAAGTYTIEIADATLACSVAQFVTVNEPTPVTLGIAITSDYNGEDISCNGASDGELTATAAGGTAPYTYLWDDPLGQTTAIATGLAAGTYNVTMTDDNGCTATISQTLTEPNALVLTTAGTDASCNGGADGTATATATNGTGAYTYLWDDVGAQTTATAINLAAGTYCVTVTDDNGCTITDCITIGEPTALALTIAVISDYNGEDISCNGVCDGEATVTVVGGTAPYTYLWDNATAQTTAIATGLCAGTSNVTVTDDNGCTATISVTLTEPTALTLTTDSTDASCNGGAD
ncbi:MAG: SprB repeat-containing protein, partial [Saprospiraceae bacterium]|nr:SprB repeat-containing protein [Saprospiraceae bacterium]